MELEVGQITGAAHGEKSPERLVQRNGYRERSLDTRLGTLNLKIPKMRSGAYFPGFLEPRKTSEKALVAVIQEAWINGVSTRKVDELVQAMGGQIEVMNLVLQEVVSFLRIIRPREMQRHEKLERLRRWLLVLLGGVFVLGVGLALATVYEFGELQLGPVLRDLSTGIGVR